MISNFIVRYLAERATGLDQITKSFHNEVGTLGFGTHTVGIMILSGVIVVGEFSLWFINKPKSVNQEEQDEERKEAKEIAKEKNDDHPVLTSDYVEDPEESAVSPPDMNRGYSANTNSDTIKSAGTGSVGVSVLQVSAEKETPKAYKRSDGEPSDQRLLTWFFFNFVFLACIILTLQGGNSSLCHGSFWVTSSVYSDSYRPSRCIRCLSDPSISFSIC